MSWYTQFLKTAAWILIPTFLVMFISEAWMVEMNPQGIGPWPDLSPRPRAFEIWLWTRNLSFLVALITGVFCLPRWQAVIGLMLTLALAMYIYWAFSTGLDHRFGHLSLTLMRLPKTAPPKGLIRLCLQ